MTVRTRSMSHSADYRSQPEAALEVPQLSGKARCPRRALVAGDTVAARYAGLVRDRSRGLLGHERLRGLEQDRTRSDELELMLLPRGPAEARHRT